MSTKSCNWAGLVFVLLFVLFLFYLLWIVSKTENASAERHWREQFQEEAVANGAGYYHPQTREFIWVKREPVEITQKRLVQTQDGRMWTEGPDGTREPYEHGGE